MNPWTLSNRPAASTAATATRAPGTSANAQGMCVRLRYLSVVLSGTSAGTDQVSVKGTNSGTVLTHDISIPSNGFATLILPGLDIRMSQGEALVIACSSGVASATESIFAEGDFVPAGYPIFQT